MKDLDYYLKLEYKMEIISDNKEGGYVVSFPDLPGCLSIGETIQEAYDNGMDAKRQWLTQAIKQGIDINEPGELDTFSGQFKLRIPKSLHKQIVKQAKNEGVSMNQYCVYLLSKNIQ